MSIAKTPATSGLVAALFALILVPAVFGPGPATAQGILGIDLYGTGLEDGDVVVVSINGEECGTLPVAADGVWAIRVYPGDCNGEAEDGAPITFTLNGDLADQTVTWAAGWLPPDPVNGITLTVGGTGPSVVNGPPEPPTLSRNSGLAIFGGGSIADLEAAATALCPGGASIWVNEPSGNGYLLFVANARFDIVNSAFRGAYSGGFDGPEPVIVNDCKS